MPRLATTAARSATLSWADAQLHRNDDATDLYERMLKVIELPMLQAAVKKHGGSLASAARQLGLHRVTLKRKIDGHENSGERSPD